MHWKRLKPYVIELLVFLFVTAFVCGFYIATKFIIIQWSFMTLILAIMVFLWLFYYVFTFVPFSLAVVLDLITNNYTTVKSEFVEQFIFRSSSFGDRNKAIKELTHANSKVNKTYYYKLIVKNKSGIDILTSSEYFELRSNVVYEFTYGKYSKALVNVRKIEEMA